MRQEKDPDRHAWMGAVVGVLIIAGLVIAGARSDKYNEKSVLKDNPDISVVDHVDDCVVKYVNHGEISQSYFIARCGNTTTTTQHYKNSTQPTAPTVTRTTITQS